MSILSQLPREFWIGLLIEIAPLLVAAGVCGVAGFLMLERVEKGGVGFALGALLGPIGLVIAWVKRDNALRDQQAGMTAHARAVDEVMAKLKATDPNRPR